MEKISPDVSVVVRFFVEEDSNKASRIGDTYIAGKVKFVTTSND